MLAVRSTSLPYPAEAYVVVGMPAVSQMRLPCCMDAGRATSKLGASRWKLAALLASFPRRLEAPRAIRKRAVRSTSLPRSAEAYRVTNKLAAPQRWLPRAVQACRVPRKLTASRISLPHRKDGGRAMSKLAASRGSLPRRAEACRALYKPAASHGSVPRPKRACRAPPIQVPADSSRRRGEGGESALSRLLFVEEGGTCPGGARHLPRRLSRLLFVEEGGTCSCWRAPVSAHPFRYAAASRVTRSEARFFSARQRSY